MVEAGRQQLTFPLHDVSEGNQEIRLLRQLHREGSTPAPATVRRSRHQGGQNLFPEITAAPSRGQHYQGSIVGQSGRHVHPVALPLVNGRAAPFLPEAAVTTGPGLHVADVQTVIGPVEDGRHHASIRHQGQVGPGADIVDGHVSFGSLVDNAQQQPDETSGQRNGGAPPPRPSGSAQGFPGPSRPCCPGPCLFGNDFAGLSWRERVESRP